MNDEKKEKNSRKLDNLINLAEKHTRTERHLEQYSHIGSEENKEHARDIQDVREEQIDSLKNDILGENEKISTSEHLKNLNHNMEAATEYMEANKDNMSRERYENMKKKQKNRQEQKESIEED